MQYTFNLKKKKILLNFAINLYDVPSGIDERAFKSLFFGINLVPNMVENGSMQPSIRKHLKL